MSSAKTLHPGKAIVTFAPGSSELYGFLDNNPEVKAHPVDHVNDPYSASSCRTEHESRVERRKAMPARDKTGPGGQGPMSGRGMGDCTNQGSVVAGPRRRGFGRGWGRGWGRGFGRGWGGGLEAVPVDDEIEGLRTESSRLKALLEGIDRRLSSFEKRD